MAVSPLNRELPPEVEKAPPAPMVTVNEPVLMGWANFSTTPPAPPAANWAAAKSAPPPPATMMKSMNLPEGAALTVKVPDELKV
jgi:hypothetical protein